LSVDAELNSVQKDLDAALPLVEKANAALGGLDINDFRNLKALKTPPGAIEKVFTCILNLLASVDPIVPVDKHGKLKTEKPWGDALKLMGNPDKFLQ